MALKRVAVLQSNYIPWKGYFDIINDVDLFVFYDDVQYTKNDWRNRNKVKTPYGSNWLTIPAGSDLSKLIYEVELPAGKWQANHWKTIEQYYKKAPYFRNYQELIQHIYLEKSWQYLSELNQYFIRMISKEILGIRTAFSDSREYKTTEKKLGRLLELVQQTEATVYVSGPAAKDYIEPAAFETAGIELVYKDYSGYPEYLQFYPPFDHFVSILDLIFHTGPEAPYYIWGWRKQMCP